MNTDRFRAQGDRQLTAEILKDDGVQRALLNINEKDMPLGVRRQLLATAVRLTPGMSPELHNLIMACRETLAVTIPIEAYVYASPQFNAMCIKPEEGRLFVALSSSLLDHFTPPELQFVLGHELAHFAFKHHDIPVAYLLNRPDRPDPGLTLKLFAWSRYAEISADRAGAVCSGNLDAIARAMFKLASGLTGTIVRPSMAELLNQLSDMQSADAASRRSASAAADWFSTHPFSPLRLQALVYTFESDLLKPGGGSVDELETKVEPLMGLMKPSYLDEDSHEAETMRRVLFAGSIALADANGDVSLEEVKAIESFFGKGSIGPALDFKRLKADLESRLKDAVTYVAPARRAQVFRDLVLVVCSDKKVDAAEATLLEQVARGMEIPSAIRDSLIRPQIEQHDPHQSVL